MAILHELVLLLHFIGFAALFGGAFTQLRGQRRVNAAMVHGAWTQLVTGLLLVAFLEMGDADVNHMKVGVKLLVLVGIVVLVLVNKKREVLADGAFWAILGLTVANAAIAVLW